MTNVINNPNFLINFGNSSQSPFSIKEFKSLIFENKELLRKKIKLKCNNNTYFLHQIHGSDGLFIDHEKLTLPSLEFKGDFLITNNINLSIGVLTADCLPIIFYDPINNISAISHAGWRGTLQNIAQVTYEHMNKLSILEPNKMKVFFGPCAKACCYEVNTDFIQFIKKFKFASKALKTLNNRFFFDMPLYNILLLEDLGIKNIDLSYNICTICNPHFCSFRREKEESGLQMTTIILK